MSRDPAECAAVVVRTAARTEQAGQVLAPRGFDFVLQVTRFDGAILPPMAVADAERVAQLLDDFAPKRVSVEVADHEDADAVRAALGVGVLRTLH